MLTQLEFDRLCPPEYLESVADIFYDFAETIGDMFGKEVVEYAYKGVYEDATRIVRALVDKGVSPQHIKLVLEEILC